MISKLKNNISKNTKIKYANDDELLKIERNIKSKLAKYHEKCEKLSAKYIILAKRKQETNKGNVKRIINVSRQIQRINTKIQRLVANLNIVHEKKFIKRSIVYKIKKKFSEIPYNKQKIVWGIIFITPWALGFLLFFLPPILKSFWWSFNDVVPSGTKILVNFVGLKNYIELFTQYVIDNNNIFNVQILLFVQNLAIDLPIILIFSLFIAVLLNTKFKGHQIVKAIFFIPVIYNISIISSTMSKGFGLYLENNTTANILLTTQLTTFLMEIGIGGSFIDIVIGSVERIFMIVNYSGIQILLFIAALQSIPNQLYEAAKVEGATKYETFWKITIPMVTPILLTAAIYTIIDSFARAPIYRFLEYAVTESRYGLASSIAMSYFGINLIIILVVLGSLKGLVFYYDKR
ncbi:MAG: putative carbohydrate transporter-like,permease [Haloplasmataceae bacterium]|jgi:ABC-type sugar transport system permease subunit|nr:putative carbohydrate transporter-like,permease [Haloplasmataceae bacterium]